MEDLGGKWEQLPPPCNEENSTECSLVDKSSAPNPDPSALFQSVGSESGGTYKLW